MKISLNTFPISGKTAITLFLILLWYGYLLAALNTRLSVGLTAESIADHYSDHSLTKSETQDIEQKGYTEEEVVVNDSAHENPPLSLRGGMGGLSSDEPLMNQGSQMETQIPPFVQGGGGGVFSDEHGHDAEKAGTGTITPQEIVQLGHIHMLGFSLLFISLGIILSLTGIRELWKVIILLILFLSFALDIGGLLLVRFVSPTLAILTVISGIGTGICMAVISLAAMYDMWIRRRQAQNSS